MSKMERSNRCKTAGTAVRSTVEPTSEPTSEQKHTCFRDILDLVLHLSDEEWKAVSRDMAKEVTRFEFAAASTKIVTMVSSAVVRRLLTSFSERFGTEAILEANDKLKKMPVPDESAQGSPAEASDIICQLAQRTVAEVKGAMLEAIRSTASRAIRAAALSAAAGDPLSQLEDLSISCTNEICEKILALYESEELDGDNGSREELGGIIHSSEEVVSARASSSWYTVSSSPASPSEGTATDGAPQTEQPFSNQFMSKASQVVSEVLQKTEQKMAAAAAAPAQPPARVSVEPEMNFLMETATSTAMEILQKLFALLVHSLREHLSAGGPCGDADQPGAEPSREILHDAQTILTDVRKQDVPSVSEENPAVSEERELPTNISPETHELDVGLRSIQESAAAQLLLEEATQAASEILVKRLSSGASLGLDSAKSSSSSTSLSSWAAAVDLDRVVSEILNQVIRGVAQELEAAGVEEGSGGRADDAAVSDEDAPLTSRSSGSSDVSSELQSLSGLDEEHEQSASEFGDAEMKSSQLAVPRGPLHFFNAVRNHLKSFCTSLSKHGADKTTDESAPEETDEDPATTMELSGVDSIRELATHFKKMKKKRYRLPLPHWDETNASSSNKHQSSSHPEPDDTHSQNMEQNP